MTIGMPIQTVDWRFDMKQIEVDIEVSARHVHLCKSDIEKLFGIGYELTPKKQIIVGYVAEERLTLVGPKGTLRNVAILGPARPETQVELAATDARNLGIEAPLRLSGDLVNTPRIKIATENGNTTEIDHGCIVAKRHIHLSKEDAEQLQVATGDEISLKIDTGCGRALTFEEVIVRVGNTRTVVHLDTDEGNAASTGKSCKGICFSK